MWKFKNKQKTLKISNIKIGGVPGQTPTVLIGSIFYHGDKKVIDEFEGKFDKTKAEEEINRQQEFSDITGNPCVLDVVGSSGKALIKYIDFISEISEQPFLVDGILPNVRIEGLKHIKEVGLSDRVIYNTIAPTYKQNEVDAIKESNVKNVIILAQNMRDFGTKGRVTVSQELISKLTGEGIENILIDCCVMDIPSLGFACKALYELKDEFGFPAGCGAHNAIGTWRGLKTKMGKQAKKPSMATAAILPIALGADFILYGPVKEADYIFPAVSLVDAAFGQLRLEEGERPGPEHPLYKIA